MNVFQSKIELHGFTLQNSYKLHYLKLSYTGEYQPRPQVPTQTRGFVARHRRQWTRTKRRSKLKRLGRRLGEYVLIAFGINRTELPE